MKTHGMRYTKEYKSWSAMRDRCLNPKFRFYDRYGGRGITIDPRWNSFEMFFKDMGPRPLGTSLDRIDNSKGYYKENCRWADYKTQNNNKRSNIKISYLGNTLTLAEWARKLNIPIDTLWHRIHKKWTISRALNQPLEIHRKLEARIL